MSLKKWFDQKWVDIGSKRKDGSYAPCGRSKLAADRKRKYPKCVPAAKAARMTESQRRSAVARKRAKPQGVGGKPTNVSTFTKKVLWWYDRNLRRIIMLKPVNKEKNPGLAKLPEKVRNRMGYAKKGKMVKAKKGKMMYANVDYSKCCKKS